MGDYSRKLDRYTNISGSTVLATGDNLSATARVLVGVNGVVPLSSANLLAGTIYIQRIQVNIITDAAQSLTLQDDAGTPVVIAGVKASPGVGPITFDFGPEGRALTQAKEFELKNSAAGLAADITWTGYWRATATQSA